MSLSLIENAFQNYLKTNHRAILPLITNDATLGAKKRLEIYYDAYRLRLLEILDSDYPKLHILMGDAAFDSLGRAYIDHFPSKYFSARYIGTHLCQFLKTSPYDQEPYLYEMAEFEWSMGDTIDSKDIPLLKPDVLNHLDLDRFGDLRVKFHPSVQCLCFQWDVPELWLAMEKKLPPRPPKKLPIPQDWLVFRNGLDSAYRSLDKTEKLALLQLQEGGSISDLCETLCEVLEEEKIPTYILTCLHQWLNEEFITEIL